MDEFHDWQGWTSCEMYGHNFDPEGTTCLDCGEDREQDE